MIYQGWVFTDEPVHDPKLEQDWELQAHEDMIHEGQDNDAPYIDPNYDANDTSELPF